MLYFQTSLKLLMFIIYIKKKGKLILIQDMQEQKIKSDFLLPTCFKKNPVKLICCDQKCTYPAFICVKEQCPCQNQHQTCYVSFYSKYTSKIQFDKKQPPENVHNSYEEIQKIIDQMIDQLSILKQDLNRAKQHYGKGKYQRQFIEKIAIGELEKINGALIKKLDEQLANWKQPQINSGQNIKKYWQIKKIKFDSIIFQINNLFSKQWKFSINRKDQSKITDRYNLFNAWLNAQTKKNVSRFQLLYRASQHQFSSTVFHSKCNKIPNIFIIIKSQTDRIFGGFNPNAMQQANSDAWINDTTRTAFIFSLDLQQVFPISEYEKSYCCNNSYGPTFGNVDFYISDKANVSTSSYGNFPKSYSIKNSKKSPNMTQLTGSTDNRSFKISQYEVYKVVFD